MKNAALVRISASLCFLLTAQPTGAQAPVGAPPQTLSASRAAQSPVEAPPLGLDDAIRLALEGNADLTVARRQVDPLRARPAQARALTPPMLEAQIWQWPVNTLNPANTNMFMLMASQDLPGRGKRAAAVTLTEMEISLAEATVAAREREITAAVTERYWDLVITRRSIAIHVASVDLLHELTDVAQAKYAAGRISQQDVLKAIVETTKLHNDLVRFQREADQARVRLNALLDRPVETPIGELTPLGETVLAATAAELQSLAMQSHPLLRVARAQIDRARAQQAVARRTGTPDWSVGAGYMLQPRQTDAWLARVSITWPRAPWSRAAIDARTAEAAAAVNAADAEAAAFDTRIRAAIAETYVRVKSAEQSLALLRTALLPQSRQALDVSRVAYQTDRVDFLAVIENERTLLDAQLSYDRTLSDWRQALGDLERAVGMSIPAAMLRRIEPSEVK